MRTEKCQLTSGRIRKSETLESRGCYHCLLFGVHTTNGMCGTKINRKLKQIKVDKYDRERWTRTRAADVDG